MYFWHIQIFTISVKLVHSQSVWVFWGTWKTNDPYTWLVSSVYDEVEILLSINLKNIKMIQLECEINRLNKDSLCLVIDDEKGRWDEGFTWSR